MISVPADPSFSSPWTTLISSQPKGARKVLTCSVPPTFNSGFTLVRIKEASDSSVQPLIFIGAKPNPAHSSSNLPGLGVEALLIRLLVA